MKHLVATGALAAGLFAFSGSEANAQYYYGGYYYPYSYSYSYAQPYYNSYYYNPGYSFSFSYSNRDWDRRDRRRYDRRDHRWDGYRAGPTHHPRSNRRTY